MENIADSRARSVPVELDNLHVVLVGTRYPGNIGSAARAMKNMGIEKLVLVAPVCEIDTEAVRLSGKAKDLLETARIHDSFDEAVSEMGLLVAATSARERKLGRELHPPRQLAEQIRERCRSEPVGLVFGSERSGLPDHLLARCQLKMTIPASVEYPVLNLAQAVMICCYEVFQADSPLQFSRDTLVTQKDRNELFAQVESVLTQIGFLSTSNPAPVMKAIRSFWGGPGMSERDLRILRGIMSQMDWYIREGHKLGPERIRKP